MSVINIRAFETYNTMRLRLDTVPVNIWMSIFKQTFTQNPRLYVLEDWKSSFESRNWFFGVAPEKPYVNSSNANFGISNGSRDNYLCF